MGLALEKQRRVSTSDVLLSDANRLSELRATKMMDSAPEQAFNRLVRLASYLLRVPLAAVSFISDTKQFFKASCGIPAPYDSARELPIDDSICRYTLNGKPLIVEDAANHTFLCRHPTTQAFNIGALVALPLISSAGHVLGALCAIDIVKRRWHPDELGILQDLTNSAMEEVELRRQVHQMYGLLRSREEVLATIVHDLRTPITAASLVAQRLEAAPMDPESITKRASRIVYNMSRAGRMIGDLLDASRIEAGKSLCIQRRWHRLGEILAEPVHSLTEIHGLRFALRVRPRDCKVFCDADAIRRVIENLAGNAVKYGAPGTAITIDAQQVQEQVVLAVHNVGNPIPWLDQAGLFEPYQRSDDAQGSGWGVGLGIVRGLIAAHHGEVSVRSSESDGTTFTAQIPRCPKERETATSITDTDIVNLS